MDYGVIDLGSNTIRLSVFRYEEGKIRLVQNKKTIAGLASCIKDGGLTEIGVVRACMALNRYKAILEEQKIEKYSVFATASLRNINNREIVLNEIKERTGIVPEILFGDEEARLDFIGVKNGSELTRGVLIDIGGGSTELVLFENGEIKRLASIPIGALNLQNKSTKGIIPTDREIRKMRKIINKAIDELQWDFESDYETMYAVGGTSRAALEIAKELFRISSEEKSFNKENVKDIVNKLRSSDPKEYKPIYKINPERIFSLAGGLVILNEVVKRFGCEIINISKNGIREGYFIDRILSKINNKAENNEN
ncbi:hypothetical protein I6E17_07085 [Fusobacterium perfoetens]|uniref:Ppx/GppA phosphatase family protein n=1 Tax=Fusobacterium perfoetens TaxID=852 RepID=UPI001F318219|nr:hypothetical protein [Fusobacterium perfoetens]MCF2625925.1 hypothetical protein [Fusobacterium perfoetens]